MWHNFGLYVSSCIPKGIYVASENQMNSSIRLDMHLIHFLTWAVRFCSSSSSSVVHQGTITYFGFFIPAFLKKDPACKSLLEYPLLAQCLFIYFDYLRHFPLLISPAVVQLSWCKQRLMWGSGPWESGILIRLFLILVTQPGPCHGGSIVC